MLIKTTMKYHLKPRSRAGLGECEEIITLYVSWWEGDLENNIGKKEQRSPIYYDPLRILPFSEMLVTKVIRWSDLNESLRVSDQRHCRAMIAKDEGSRE